MSEKPNDLAPKQKRSRETLQRLLGATLKTLDEVGLAGATVPRIAASAEVAPANIYRRFKDKDALLRAAFLHLLKRANEGNREHLSAMVVRSNLEETVKALMQEMIKPYRQHPLVMAALLHFVDSDTDQEFLTKALEIVRDNLNLVAAVLLVHKAEIQRPDPEAAARFAVLSATSSIEGITMDPRGLWCSAMAMTDEELVGELAVACLAYLRAGKNR